MKEKNAIGRNRIAMFRSATVRAWLVRKNDAVFVAYASIAAFSAYSCMYAFRKPFAAGHFTGLEFMGFDYKTVIIIAQVLGYMLSKFIGIKVISEISWAKRPVLMVLFIGIAELALVLFAIVSPPYNILFLFVNGLPLGMVWGIVFSYLEGRKFTDIITLCLCASFIVASGFVKTIGKMVLNWGFSDFAMPMITGALFFVPLLFFLWMLEGLPPPSKEDVALKTQRIPMNGKERKRFFMSFAPGLILMIIAYLILTAYRDFRDNYMADFWQALGLGKSAAIFTSTEIPIALAVLLLLAFLLQIKNNSTALVLNHVAIIAGFSIVGIATLLFQAHRFPPVLWIILVGFGLFLSYIPFNGIVFDRLIAVFGYKSNAGFLIYVADFFGYLASVGVLIYKSFFQRKLTYIGFFISGSYVLSLTGVVVMILSLAYFKTKKRSLNARTTTILQPE